MQYTLEGVITCDEYTEAGRRMLFTRRYMTSLFFAWILSILFLVFPGKTDTIISLAFYAFLVAVCTVLVQWLYMPHKFKQDLQKKPKLTESKRWIFCESYCEVISESVTLRYQWNEFCRLIRCKHAVLLVMQENTGSSLVVPLRLFGTQIEAAINEIEQKISACRTKKKYSS